MLCPMKAKGKLYAHFSADGCIESFLDFAKSRNTLEGGGWELTGELEDADAVLVNSCVVGEIVERNCIEDMRQVKGRMKPAARLIVTGCMPAYNMKALEELGASFAYSSRDFHRLLDEYGLTAPEEEVGELEREYMGPYNVFNWVTHLLHRSAGFGLPVPEYLYRRFSMVENETMFFLRINRGCRQSCTYCATKFTAGRLLSTPPEEVLRRFDEALDAGKRNIVLCGEETGAYGLDIGTNFITLLERLLERPNNFILSVRQHFPTYIMKDLDRYCAAMADPRVKCFTIPLQSGSDRILKAMRRNHTSADARRMVWAIHRAAPHVMLRTHFIAGFPTETDREFDETYRFIKETPWDMVLVYPFTSRPRTKAAKIEPKVSQKATYFRMAKVYTMILKKIYLNNFRLLPLTSRDPMEIPVIYPEDVI